MSSSTRISLETGDRCPSILLAAASREMEDAIHVQLASRYRIRNTGSNKEILGLVKGGEFECVLIDMARPADDTADLLRRLKRQTNELPVLVMCSSPEISAGVEAVRAGAADFIIKDVEIAGLSKRIDKLLGRAPTKQKGPGWAAGSDRQWSPGKMVHGRRPHLRGTHRHRQQATWCLKWSRWSKGGPGKTNLPGPLFPLFYGSSPE